MNILRIWIAHAALLLCALACSQGTPDGTCLSDDDCPALGFRCNVAAGLCACASDEACDDGFFCNSSGVCQLQAGCSSNADCPETDFCDLDSGECLAGPPLELSAACGVASHCPFGSICEAGTCIAGCFSDGDCNLGEVCANGQCFGGDGICSNKDFCEYGELCQQNMCTRDFRGPYCRRCTQRTIQNPEPCDDPRNFCLINNRELGGFTQFCGTDCSLGQPCPSGYGCNNVVILTESVCNNRAQCQCDGPVRFATSTCTVATPCVPGMNSGSCVIDRQPDCNGGADGAAQCVVQQGQTVGNCTCVTDDDCDGDQVCTSGLCCGATVRPERECRGGEGTVSGFCSCAIDDDCPNNSCDGSRGAWSITGEPCTPGNGDCGPIPCVNGGCLIGQNCAPEAGLSCTDLLR